MQVQLLLSALSKKSEKPWNIGFLIFLCLNSVQIEKVDMYLRIEYESAIIK